MCPHRSLQVKKITYLCILSAASGSPQRTSLRIVTMRTPQSTKTPSRKNRLSCTGEGTTRKKEKVLQPVRRKSGLFGSTSRRKLDMQGCTKRQRLQKSDTLQDIFISQPKGECFHSPNLYKKLHDKQSWPWAS
jgi:hypothetical protein